MKIDDPTFVSKSGYFLPIWLKVCLINLAFSYSLGKFYELALSNKKSSFVLVSGFVGCCTFKILLKYFLKGSFFTKRPFKPP